MGRWKREISTSARSVERLVIFGLKGLICYFIPNPLCVLQKYGMGTTMSEGERERIRQWGVQGGQHKFPKWGRAAGCSRALSWREREVAGERRRGGEEERRRGREAAVFEESCWDKSVCLCSGGTKCSVGRRALDCPFPLGLFSPDPFVCICVIWDSVKAGSRAIKV